MPQSLSLHVFTLFNNNKNYYSLITIIHHLINEQLGHCEHSPKYMGHYCRKVIQIFVIFSHKFHSKLKPLKLLTLGLQSLFWRYPKNLGYPKSVEDLILAATTLTRVLACSDKNIFCGYWAKIGECKSDSRFMKLFCKRSCGKC